jgi:hypothetical protein
MGVAEIVTNLFQRIKGMISIGVVFQQIDDANDSLDRINRSKAANVWYLATSKNIDPSKVNPDSIKKHGKHLQVTKDANEAERTRSTYVERGDEYIYILIEPTTDWSDHYEPHVIKTRVHSGVSQTITVSLKPKSARGNPSPAPVPSKSENGFKL